MCVLDVICRTCAPSRLQLALCPSAVRGQDRCKPAILQCLWSLFTYSSITTRFCGIGAKIETLFATLGAFSQLGSLPATTVGGQSRSFEPSIEEQEGKKGQVNNAHGPPTLTPI